MRKRSAKPYDPPNYGPDAVMRRCDATNCAEEGQFRAPKSRDQLNDYFWFCLDHVRQYNKAWNYYANMSATDVETDIRRSTTWDRPSWPFGTRDGRQARSQAYRINDPFGFMEDDEPDSAGAERRGPRGAAANTDEAKAAKLMELQPPLTLESLKRRYKELVKLHHPDANGGDKEAEERLKQINEAYATLRRFLT